MTKKKVITTEEFDASGELQNTDIETEATPEELELSDFLQSVGTSGVTIKIYKIVDGQQSYCCTAEPANITEDFILKRFGGGRYRLLPLLNGRYAPGGSRFLQLYQPPDLLNPTVSPHQFDVRNDGEITLLREQINRQHDMFLKLLEKQGSSQPSIAEIFTLMSNLQANNKAPDLSSMLAPVLDLFGKSMELAKETVGTDDSKMQWFKIISDGLNKLPAILSSLNPMKKGGGDVAQTTMAPEQAAKHMLGEAIAWLKKKALAGKDPDLQVDFLIDNFDDENYKNLAVLMLNQPFDSFGQIDPEIMQEPLKTWFKKVYDGLREEINEKSSSVAGKGGEPSDLGGNEKTNS